MNRADLCLKIAGLLVAAIGVAVPAYVAYDLSKNWPSSEKLIEVEHGLKFDATGGVAMVPKKAQVTVTFEGKSARNVWIARDVIRNIGRVAVLPSDYIEKLTISTRPPWSILEVDNTLRAPGNVVFHWDRKSETSFEAEPSLLNPGDAVDVVVYLTNPNADGSDEEAVSREPAVDWGARIVNLRTISTHRAELTTNPFGFVGSFPVVIFLAGNAVLFTIVAALLFEFAYINLLALSGLIRRVDPIGIALLLAVSFLSFSAAESSAWLLFPNPLSRLTPAYGINSCVLAVHWACLIGLYLYARKRPARRLGGTGRAGGGQVT